MVRPRRVAGSPTEWLLYDGLSNCPYLPEQTARLPLRLPSRPLTADELSQRLREGDRRNGRLLYRPTCPTCHACEAIRIDVNSFAPSKTQRRVFRRGESVFQTEIGPPLLSRERVVLYNRHKIERDLLIENELLDAADYQQFLVDTCTDSVELRYRIGGELAGIAITDRAADALSAVYCFFDTRFGRWSPGTYSILKQIALCREWGLRYLYLGLYVARSETMAYKATFLPHERLIHGEWRAFDRAA